MNESTLVPREEMSDLDWLARNVHVWPFNMFDSKPTEKYVWHQPYCGGDILAVFRDRPSVFTKDQWLARRAELQNKPSWDDAPEWGEWLAQDGDGEWFWYVSKPFVDEENDNAVWELGDSFDHELCQSGEVLGDWRDTLEKRPEQKAFEPFTSIEDNQEKDMKQDNGWFEREELPPVGVKCETLVEPELQWVSAEVVAHRDRFAIVWITSEKCGAQSDAPKHFRPIRTERDVLLSVITEELNHYDTDGKLADAILAAGFSLGAK